MKHVKHSIFFAIMISMLIFSITAVSASDANSNNTLAGDAATAQSGSTSSIETTADTYDNQMQVEKTDNQKANEITNADDKKTAGCSDDKKATDSDDKKTADYSDGATAASDSTSGNTIALKDSKKSLKTDEVTVVNSFSSLQNLIDSAAEGSVVVLDSNYTWNSESDADITNGIAIGSNIAINGNGFTVNATGATRIFDIALGSNVTIANITLTGGYVESSSTSNGGAIRVSNANLTVINSTLSNNYAGIGGAIYTTNSLRRGSVTLIDDVFVNNSAKSGGAIYNYFYSNMTIENSTFVDNEAGYGGAIYNDDKTTVAIENSTFANNSAKYGGVVYNKKSDLTVNGSSFDGNAADNVGGVIVNAKSGNVVVANSTLTSNHASNGSVIYGVQGKTNTLTNNVLTDNTATSDGGLEIAVKSTDDVADNEIYNSFSSLQNLIDSAADGSVIVLDKDYTRSPVTDKLLSSGIRINKTITIDANGHTLDANGDNARIFSIVASPMGNLTLKNAILTGANYTNNGGAIFVGGILTVENSTFKDNAARIGGAIYVYGGNLTAIGSTFTNNTATTGSADQKRGGAIYIYKSKNATLINDVFTGNNATLYGGAINVNGYSNVSISDSKFTENTASYGGAVYNNINSNVTITNTAFDDNSANYGGALYNIQESNLIVDGSSFAGNTAVKTGGAITNGRLSNATVTGSSFTANHATSGSVIYGGLGNSNTLTDNTFTDNTATTNNKQIVVNKEDTVGDNIYDGGKINVTIDVAEIDGSYQISDNIPITGNITFNDTYISKYTGVATLYENGEKIASVNIDSTSNKVSFKFNYNPDTSGIHILTVQYDDALNNNFKTTTETVHAMVNKLTSQITVDAVTTKANKTTTLTAHVYDENGNPITGGKVVFKVNGVTIKDANGNPIYAYVADGIAQITTSFNFKAKSYTLYAVYGGNDEYESARVSNGSLVITQSEGQVTVEAPQTATSGNTITFNVTVKGEDGSLVNGGKVVCKINGVSLRDSYGNVMYATVKNGIAQITYKLPAKMSTKIYNITAVYSNTDYIRLEGNTTMAINRA